MLDMTPLGCLGRKTSAQTILVRQTNQHMLFTGKHRCINTKFVSENSLGRGYNCLTEESITHLFRPVTVHGIIRVNIIHRLI